MTEHACSICGWPKDWRHAIRHYGPYLLGGLVGLVIGGAIDWATSR